MKTTTTKEVFMNQEKFDTDLEHCLLIVSYPDKHHKYYVCEYTSPELQKSIIHIYITI